MDILSQATITRIAKLTEINNHCEALIEIVDAFDYLTHFQKIFRVISYIRNLENHLPYQISLYRTQKTSEMLKLIAEKSGQETADQINRLI